MLREWLLIVWLGTSTNFTVQGTYWSLSECQQGQKNLIENLGAKFVVVCTQNLKEGRSELPKRGIGVGISK